ncbi:hypothetical protein LIT25_06090 [Bacillus sp. F19]|nr:hypothetical protein LIT25_06090 [Bacillus sp. F19]
MRTTCTSFFFDSKKVQITFAMFRDSLLVTYGTNKSRTGYHHNLLGKLLPA